MIQFKILTASPLFQKWAYFLYQNINGIGIVKSATNKFSQWEVGEIPEGAIIC
jgi:hypothetical protein